MTTTFAVCDVPLARGPKEPLDWSTSVASLLRAPVEAISTSDRRLVACTDAHPLALAAHDAFYEHRPLALSPDAVWFCIAQGFANHMTLNAERQRHRFVRHPEKKRLLVVRPDFILGQPNPWPEAFGAFSAQIAEHVGKLRDLVVCDFSTTGPVERAASEVLLMDTFQAYFEYVIMWGCGIPSITLRGNPDDWRSIRRRAAALSEFELEAWAEALLPILDQFVAAAEGRVDVDFWRSFFRHRSDSGPAELTGWIHVLFPYLRDGERLKSNPYVTRWESALRHAERRKRGPIWNDVLQGPSLREIPSGLSSAPVKCVDLRDGSEHPLRFVAGMFGVSEDVASRALEPEFGWAVVHDDPAGVLGDDD